MGSHHRFVHGPHGRRHTVGQGEWGHGKSMNIRQNFALGLAEDLPDLVQERCGVRAIVRRLCDRPHFKPHQRRIRRPKDLCPQIGGRIVKQQDHVRRPPRRLQPKGCAHRTVAFVGEQDQAKALRDGKRQQQHGQQLAPHGLGQQPVQKAALRGHGNSLTSAARL